MMTPIRSPHPFTVVSVAVSLAVLVTGSVLMSKSRALSRGGIGEAVGRVDLSTVKYRSKKGRDAVKLAYTVDGEDHQVAGVILYVPGQVEYPVYYHKSHPERAFTERRRVPSITLLLIIGCLMSFMSLDGMAREMGVLPPKR